MIKNEKVYIAFVKADSRFPGYTVNTVSALYSGCWETDTRAWRGETISVKGKVVGYANIGQKFSDDKYFWSRPSAAGCNASGSSGSNKGPSNPDYLKDVQAHVDSFLVHNPGIKKEDIPVELVTYSGSGLDPDLSVAGAKIQIKRVGAARKIQESRLNELVDSCTEKPLLGIFGPAKVNVLKLNVALDNLN